MLDEPAFDALRKGEARTPRPDGTLPCELAVTRGALRCLNKRSPLERFAALNKRSLEERSAA
jgi:hypothetical protein